jgi:hypothetical protein
LLTFETVEEACDALDQVEDGYLEHCEGARRVAETYFDSSLVLASILDRVA